MKKILVTGAAGFIGFHLSKKLLREGNLVVGIDNLNDYYSPELKEDRLRELDGETNFFFQKDDISDLTPLEEIFATYEFDIVYHMAAQAGVRYSLSHPHTYVKSNLEGFVNILESCRNYGIKHLIYASSSSVYGLNVKQPYSVHDVVDHPVSLYAATKKSNELMAHTYAHLYDLPTTGLRFFTVYGPWGRPDMAYFKFVNRILNDQPIDIYNHGDMSRDFTYVDDIVESLSRLMDKIPVADPQWDPLLPDPSISKAPYRVFNIGNNSPVSLMEFINVIQDQLGIKAKINYLPMQPGDVKNTWADSSDLYHEINYLPQTRIQDGLSRFIDWYKQYYKCYQT